MLNKPCILIKLILKWRITFSLTITIVRVLSLIVNYFPDKTNYNMIMCHVTSCKYVALQSYKTLHMGPFPVSSFHDNACIMIHV